MNSLKTFVSIESAAMILALVCFNDAGGQPLVGVARNRADGQSRLVQNDQSTANKDLAESNRDNQNGIDEDQIKRWVLGLTSDKYAERIEAMNQLIKSGPVCVPILARSIETGGTDFKIRGIRILETIAENLDVEISLEAEEKLLALKKSEVARVSELATAALDRIFLAKQTLALKRLVDLGAEWRVETEQIGPTAMNLSTMVFGEKFKGSMEDLRNLRFLRKVFSFEFVGERFDDELANYLPTHSSLISIGFKDTRVSNLMLNRLTEFDEIKRVVVQYTKAVDIECLDDLKKIKGLVDVKLIGTGVPRSELKNLQKNLENVAVDLRTGGFLGIQYTRGSTECRITTVVKDEAAEKAGVKVGDIIVEYDGKKVTTPETLSPLLSDHEVGHEAKMKIKRGEKTLELNVKLTKWN